MTILCFIFPSASSLGRGMKWDLSSFLLEGMQQASTVHAQSLLLTLPIEGNLLHPLNFKRDGEASPLPPFPLHSRVLCWRRGGLREQRWKKSRHLGSSAPSFRGESLPGSCWTSICSPGVGELCHCWPSVPEDLLSNCIPSRTKGNVRE